MKVYLGIFATLLLIVGAVFMSFAVAKNSGDPKRASCFKDKNLQNCKELEKEWINDCNHHGSDACFNLGVLNDKIYINKEKAFAYYTRACELGVELSCERNASF